MCGIAGIYRFSPEVEVSRDTILKQLSTIKHRGPDSYGIYNKLNFGFGMQRLAILDLTNGDQPMFDSSGAVGIVFNGEIYNYKEIRAKLKKRGVVFKTDSDTEVILLAFIEYGLSFLELLNGMFAIAIWDSRDGEALYLFRDRIGVKPLYYYLDENQIIFGSELKAVLEVPGVSRTLSVEGLSWFLALGYVPAPWSMINLVYKLPPGHYLVCKNGQTNTIPYWALKTDFAKRNDFKEAKADFLNLFSDSVEKRLISHVSVGAFLSGGLDSSAVTAMMCRASEAKVNSFSIGIKNDNYHDETQYALQVSKHLGTSHKVLKVGSEVLSLLDLFVYHFDEPFADYAAFPTFSLSQMAAEYVKVVLSGDGGDELFAGYDKYVFESYSRKYRQLPSWARTFLFERPLNSIKSLLSPNSIQRMTIEQILTRAEQSTMPDKERYVARMNIFNEVDRSKLLNRNANRLDISKHLESFWSDKQDSLSNQLLLDTMFLLPENMMTKVDRASMAFSLEVRSPFVDYRIVEFAQHLPSKWKIKNGNTKYFLKQAFAEILPRKIINRKKHGFSTPLDKWLRVDFENLVAAVLNPKVLDNQGLFNSEVVGKLVSEHYNGKANHGQKIFMLLVVQLWLERFKVDIIKQPFTS